MADRDRPRKSNYSAPALEKGFDVFELLTQFPGGLTISEIATRLERSINELFRLIVVMERRGYLRKAADTDRYSVAYKMLDIAYRATPVQNLTRAASPILYDLAHRARQSCHLVVAAGGHGLVIAREENPGPTSFGVRLGAHIDLLSSCSGNVLLAYAPRERLDELLPAAVDADALATRLGRIRDDGFVRRQSPMTYGVVDISHPVFGFDGRIAAALTIPFLERIDGSHPVSIDDVQRLAAVAAEQISTALGAHDSSPVAARPVVTR